MTAGPDTRLRPAVILSSARDRMNYAPVSDALRNEGLDVIELCFDDVLCGRQQLSVEIIDGRATMSCGRHTFDAVDVVAAWWRKPQWVRVEREDPLMRISIELELERTAHTLATLVPADRWLNAPDAIRRAESKLRQLVIAAELGFATPPTLVGNDWGAVRSHAAVSDLVFKSLRGGLWAADGNRVVFTSRVDEGRIGELARDGHAPWPGLFQTYVASEREWRVYVIGDHVLAAAVELDAELVDWRKHQLSEHVRFAAAELDPVTSAACVALTHELGLRYAAIDLIEDPAGRMWFLEANSNGQYGWLEQDPGLAITRSIAAELLSIASARQLPTPSLVADPTDG